MDWRGIRTVLVRYCIFIDAGGKLTPAVTRNVSMRSIAPPVKAPGPLDSSRGPFICVGQKGKRPRRAAATTHTGVVKTTGSRDLA